MGEEDFTTEDAARPSRILNGEEKLLAGVDWRLDASPLSEEQL
jgi:hypothetical protein